MAQPDYRVLNRTEVGEERPPSGEKSIAELCQLEQVDDGELTKEFLIAAAVDTCLAGSIYSCVWASRRLTPPMLVAMSVTTTIQLVVPFFLLRSHPGAFQHMAQCFSPDVTPRLFAFDDEQWWDNFGKKLTALVLSVHLMATFTGCLKRALNMIFMAPMLPDYHWASAFGGWVVISSLCLATVATAVLFVEDASVQGILLNSIALNFLPDVDCSMTQLCSVFDIPGVSFVQKRLASFAENWPQSKECQEYFAWLQMPLKQRIAVRPYQEIVWMVFYTMLFGFVVTPLAIFGLVQC